MTRRHRRPGVSPTSVSDMGVRDMTASGADTIDWPDSPLDAVDAAFAKLTCDPDPLSLDLDPIEDEFGDCDDSDGDVPRGVMPLPALDRWLQEHRRAYTVR